MSKEGQLAPIVLFVYNRLMHTRETVEALKKNHLASESKLIIFSDAPKNENAVEAVKEVRDYIHTIAGFQTVEIIERDTNFGLAKSVITGVTNVVGEYGKVIVLEDDLITAPYFLEYMNEGLLRYEHKKEVFSITGYSFINHIDKEQMPQTYFLKLTSSWSWGTWKEKWDCFDAEAKGWEILKKDKKLRKRFNCGNTFAYYPLLQNQMEKKNVDSWAIRWYWSVFKKEGVSLFPLQPMVSNIGFDGSGTHCGADENGYRVSLYQEKITEFSIEVKEDAAMRKTVYQCFEKKKISFIERVLRKIITLKDD